MEYTMSAGLPSIILTIQKDVLNGGVKPVSNGVMVELKGNKYGDQKYLDQFPKLFKNVHIIKNEACGLAPWNISEYDYREDLILFHYQSLRCVTDWLYTISLPSTNKSALNRLNHI